MESAIKVNLGCGHKKLEGYLNVDCDASLSPDLVCDISKGLPFEDRSVERVVCEQVLEHISDYKYLISEIHRVLKFGGSVKFTVPHKDCLAAYGDPDHVRHFVMETFMHYGDPRWFQPCNFSGQGMFDLVDGAIIKWKNADEDASLAGKYFTEIMVEMIRVKKSYWVDREKKEFKYNIFILNREDAGKL